MSFELFIFQEFSMDMAHFRDRVFEFDCRLGSILNHAFNDCSSCEAVFKVHVYVNTLLCIARPVAIHDADC